MFFHRRELKWARINDFGIPVDLFDGVLEFRVNLPVSGFS